jgi:hypothetical protein
MGKSVVATNLLSRAKAFWGWFIKKSPAFIVLTSLTVVSVFGLGVGGTLAATGVIPNPFSSQSTLADEAASSSSGEQSDEEESNDYDFGRDASPPREYDWDGNTVNESVGEWAPGSTWTSLGSSGELSYRWSTSKLHTRFIGPCPPGLVSIFFSIPNYSYLSEPFYLPVSGTRVFSLSGLDNCRQLYTESFGHYKCFNYNEVWVDIVGPTPLEGFYKIPIPAVIPKENCPAGAEQNDPTRFLGVFGSDVYERLKDYPEAVITPPTRTSPPKIEWGPYVPSAPSPTPTTESSPTPTTEPTPTPTTETSPTPTTEPSPTPTSP